MDIRNKLEKSIPTALRPIVRKIILLLPDNPFDKSLTPPRTLTVLYGSGDSEEIGRRWVEWFIKCGALRPHDNVLDVGCGIGRLAIPLTKYLDPVHGGSYSGFDIIRKGIEWCDRHITSKYSHFEFQTIDIYNGHYNPNGKLKASEYRFPFLNNTFDFVVLISVFTHMFRKDLENYLSEVSRVLKEETGKCCITYFLLNQETRELMKEGRSSNDFCYAIDEYSFMWNQKDPEVAIAYEESYLKKIYQKLGISINNDSIYYGNWRDTTKNLKSAYYYEYQDLIIGMKN